MRSSSKNSISFQSPVRIAPAGVLRQLPAPRRRLRRLRRLRGGGRGGGRKKSWVSVAKLEGENCTAGSDGHHLLATVQEGNRRGSNFPSGIHSPQFFAGF